jgi:6-phosphogluconate dehydrogenase (decarboxylating)
MSHLRLGTSDTAREDHAAKSGLLEVNLAELKPQAIHYVDVGTSGGVWGSERGYYLMDLNLADIAEDWRRGSVIASWLLGLAAIALLESPGLAKFADRVSDSGEGRWTIMAAIDEAVPAPVLSAALYERFASRGGADFANKLLSALRHEFGGHEGEPAAPKGGA